MYFQDKKGCFKIAGWNKNDKTGALYVEKMSGASVLVTENKEKANFIFNLLCQKAQLEELSIVNLPDRIFCNTEMVFTDGNGNIFDEEEIQSNEEGKTFVYDEKTEKMIEVNEVFVNLLPHHLKDSVIEEEEKKKQAMKEVKTKVEELDLVKPEDL